MTWGFYRVGGGKVAVNRADLFRTQIPRGHGDRKDPFFFMDL